MLSLIHVRAFPSFYLWRHSLPVIRLDRPLPRSWVGFGRCIVRGRSVSSHCCVLIAVVSCLCPPPPSLPPRMMCCTEISGVHVSSRDILTPALTCNGIRSRVPACVRASRVFLKIIWFCFQKSYRPSTHRSVFSLCSVMIVFHVVEDNLKKG